MEVEPEKPRTNRAQAIARQSQAWKDHLATAREIAANPKIKGVGLGRIPGVVKRCGGCQKRKELMNKMIPGSGDLVERITTVTGIKRLVDGFNQTNAPTDSSHQSNDR